MSREEPHGSSIPSRVPAAGVGTSCGTTKGEGAPQGRGKHGERGPPPTLTGFALDVQGQRDALVDELHDLLEILLTEVAGGQRGGTWGWSPSGTGPLGGHQPPKRLLVPQSPKELLVSQPLKELLESQPLIGAPQILLPMGSCPNSWPKQAPNSHLETSGKGETEWGENLGTPTPGKDPWQALSLTEAQPPGCQSTLVPRARVLVGGDGDELQHPLCPRPVDALGPQVHQHQVVVGATWREKERGDDL